MTIFIQEYVFKNIVCKMKIILSRPQRVNAYNDFLNATSFLLRL